MKKIAVLLTLGVLVGYLATADAQRGDLYGARALLALEQAFKTTGVLTFPNYAAAPVACNAANRGVYYYDTVLTNAYVCGAAGWLAVGGGGLTVGTANTIPKWNAVPDDLVDTLLVEAGVPAAGAGGSVLTQTTTLNAMDNNDTINLVDLNVTNADHAGVNNILTGLNIWGIIGDDQADEFAIQAGVGWDAHLWGNTSVLMMGSDLNVVSLLDDTYGVVVSFDLAQAAGETNRWQTIVATLAIMDGVGVDTATGLNIAMTNANHTDAGAGVFVYGIDIGGLVQDPQAAEYAINIGDGWDYAIVVPDGGAADNSIQLGDTPGADADIFWAGQTLTFDTDATAGNSVDFLMNSGGLYRLIGSGGVGSVVFDMLNVANAGYNLLELDVIATNVLNGSDIVNMINLDWNEGEFATGASNFHNGINIEAITPDADVTQTGIHLDASWDYALWVGGTAADIDHGATTTVLLAPTLAANDNANDQRNVQVIDVDIPNGSAGLVTGLWIDEVTDDINTIDSAILVEGGWDSAITIFERGGIATSNPLTGSIYIYLDDSADYSGAGGNDCWLIARDSAGANHLIVEIVLNGACP